MARRAGATGVAGATGASATVAVGTTTTGLPGSAAAVTNTGTPSAGVFNFTVPQGPTGATGAAGAGFTWAQAWNSSTEYAVNQIVSYNGSSWISILDDPNTNHAPATSPTYWQVLADGFNFTKAWNSATAYNPTDVVTELGSTFIAILANSNTDPNQDYFVNGGLNWQLLAQAGATGATGQAAATVNVGTTTTLSPGSSATVTNSGDSSNAVFNFGIPQGVTGPTGTVGRDRFAGPTRSARANWRNWQYRSNRNHRRERHACIRASQRQLRGSLSWTTEWRVYDRC